MMNTRDILETITMIDDENLDVRTITMGISLLDCIGGGIESTCDHIYDKICRYAGEKPAKTSARSMESLLSISGSR